MEIHLNDQSTPVASKSTYQRVDQYGFERSEEHESNEHLTLTVLTRRSKKWSKLLQGTGNVEKTMKVKRYVRKGVPCEHRAQMWMAASGAHDQMGRNPGHYHSLLNAQHDPEVEDAVRADIHRTFPDNTQFRDSSHPCLQKALFNVLLAYGHHNKDVGYCQGMNFVAGYLLIITKDEEKSFWLMDALLGKILPDYYTRNMLGLQMDQEVLGELIRLKVPNVWKVLNQHNVMWTLVVSRWFICLYIDILPVEVRTTQGY
ncbi:growth hormone-regulated TBC protein 1 [Triplophysa rosa]|uniref:Growth hormone-regulated TBC protein 1 n=1 Tax=Triplophysa rosa TaxID=992332 RepID=A0A9W7WV27_TRIRA|nr:growth hormone-regulated TBC protein 1 [Triplophysa rosa]